MQNTILFPQSLIQKIFQFCTENNHSGYFGLSLSLENMNLCEKVGDLHEKTLTKFTINKFQNLFFSIITCEVFHSFLQEVKST